MNHQAMEDDMLMPYIKILMEGYTRSVNHAIPLDVVPDWFDVEKFKRGQKFAMDNYFSLNFAEMISLYVLFSFPTSLGPLIFTGNSDTVMKSFKRYLSTVDRVESWYTGDPFNTNDAAHINLKAVNAFHLKVAKSMETCPKESLEEKLGMKAIISKNRFQPSLHSLMKVELCDNQNKKNVSQCPFELFNHVFISQSAMSITQFAFMGLIVTFPEKLGVTTASTEDFEAFIHLWRCLGHLLGIDEKYNFCNGSLTEVQRRCKDLITFWVKPNLINLSPQWEHMSRCMSGGIGHYIPGVKFESSFLFLCELFGLKTSAIFEALSWYQLFNYYLTKFVMHCLLRMPPIKALYNWLLRKKIARISNLSLRCYSNTTAIKQQY